MSHLDPKFLHKKVFTLAELNALIASAVAAVATGDPLISSTGDMLSSSTGYILYRSI